MLVHLCPLMPSLLDTSREADHREEEPVQVKVLKHALHWEAVDAEGDAGNTQVKAAAHHIICPQGVLRRRCHRPSNTTCAQERGGKELKQWPFGDPPPGCACQSG